MDFAESEELWEAVRQDAFIRDIVVSASRRLGLTESAKTLLEEIVTDEEDDA